MFFFQFCALYFIPWCLYADCYFFVMIRYDVLFTAALLLCACFTWFLDVQVVYFKSTLHFSLTKLIFTCLTHIFCFGFIKITEMYRTHHFNTRPFWIAKDFFCPDFCLLAGFCLFLFYFLFGPFTHGEHEHLKLFQSIGTTTT